MSKLVLFDFDKTIINKDTGYCFIVFSLRRSILRTMLALLSLSFAWIPYLSSNTRYLGNSLFLWLATVGLSDSAVAKMKSEFIQSFTSDPSFVLYQDAVSALNAYIAAGHALAIVSGSSDWMVKDTMKVLDLPEVDIIASRERHSLGGLISAFHCYAENKVTAIRETLNLEDYSSVIGYSDSVTDLPMLSLCDDRHLVNPGEVQLRKFTKAFNDQFTTHHWQ